MFQGRIFQYRRRRRKLPPAGASPPAQARRRKPAGASRPAPPHVRHGPRRLTLTLFHAHVMHVSRFGQFADVGVSSSSPSSPRTTLSLLYCDSCQRHSTTLRTRLIIAQGGGHCTGRTTSYLATFFRPCSQTALQGEAGAWARCMGEAIIVGGPVNEKINFLQPGIMSTWPY